MTSLSWTSKDLELLPDNGKRYEIIDGELYISQQPHWYHQLVCSQLWGVLQAWSNQTKLGIANFAPGVIFDIHLIDDIAKVAIKRIKSYIDSQLYSANQLPGMASEKEALRNRAKNQSSKSKRQANSEKETATHMSPLFA